MDRQTHIHARMRRIESKCDRILSELSALRKSILADRNDFDEVIDRLHRSACEMRRQSAAQHEHYARLRGI